MLTAAREEYGGNLTTLRSARSLTADQLALLTPLVRRLSIEDAAFSMLPTQPLRSVLACLVGTVVASGGFSILAPHDGSWSTGLYLAAYLLTALAFWFIKRWVVFQMAVYTSGLAVIAMLAADGVIGLVDLRVGKYAVALAAVEGFSVAGYGAAVAELTLLNPARRYHFFPRVARRARATLSPAERVAVRLAGALGEIGGLPAPWRTGPSRSAVCARLRSAAKWLESGVPYEVWAAGGGRLEVRRTRWRCRHVAARLKALQAEFAEATQAAEFNRLCAELAAMTVAVAAGDWKPVMQQEEPPPRRAYRAWVKRLTPAFVLVAAAATLSFVPGRHGDLSGLQLALVAAAVLSVARVEGSARDEIVQAYRDVTK